MNDSHIRIQSSIRLTRKPISTQSPLMWSKYFERMSVNQTQTPHNFWSHMKQLNTPRGSHRVYNSDFGHVSFGVTVAVTGSVGDDVGWVHSSACS